jgi:hypothetical protein
LRAETAGEFADAIVRLYSDPDLWTTIATNSLGAIEPFSTTHVAPRLCDVVESVCSDVSSPM